MTLDMMIETMEQFLGKFWTRLDEMVEEITAAGLDVVDYNCEYVEVSFEDYNDVDHSFVFRLGGTSNTIIVADIEEV